MDYSESVRAVCARKNVPITHLERDCGFCQGTITRWSRIFPQIDKFEKVANVLDCTVDELCGRVAYTPKDFEQRINETIANLISNNLIQSDKATISISDDEQLVLRKFRALSDAKKLRFLFSIMNLDEEDPQ